MAASAGALLAEQFEQDARLRANILAHRTVGGYHHRGVAAVLAQKAVLTQKVPKRIARQIV